MSLGWKERERGLGNKVEKNNRPPTETYCTIERLYIEEIWAIHPPFHVV